MKRFKNKKRAVGILYIMANACKLYVTALGNSRYLYHLVVAVSPESRRYVGVFRLSVRDFRAKSSKYDQLHHQTSASTAGVRRTRHLGLDFGRYTAATLDRKPESHLIFSTALTDKQIRVQPL